jgi:hypothetical protein
MFGRDYCGEIGDSGRVADDSSDTNSSRVSVFDFEAIIPAWRFFIIEAWSILLRLPITVTSFLLTCQLGLLGILCRMEKQDRLKPTSPRCSKCGEQPKFTTSMLDPPTGRTFHMFDCQCGDRTWISEKVAA